MRRALRAFPLLFLLILLAPGRAAGAGAWQAPLRPLTVTRGFEPPPTPYAPGHRGVDLGGVVGEPVLAAATGVVSYAGPLAGRGVVVIVHGALRTTYEPVQAVVSRGARVVAGQRIGTLDAGHRGCPVTACLHWGLLRGETYLDPLKALGRQQVRLLPPADELPSLQRVRSTPALATSAVSSLAPAGGSAMNPGVTWSAAAVAGAGVVMLRRRR